MKEFTTDMEVVTKDTYQEFQQSVKRRRRAVKLCLTCRERKVKCDFRKPICGSCKTKGVLNCHYQSFFKNNGLPSPQLSSKDALEEEIKSLTRELQKYKQAHKDDLTSWTAEEIREAGSTPIDARRFDIMLLKENRRLYAGITSFKSVAKKELTSNFFEYFRTTVKKERNDWKLMNNKFFSSYHPLTNVDPVTLLVNLQNFLPSYEILLEYLERFFNGIWIQFFPVVDKDTVLRSFKEIFLEVNGQLRISLPDKKTVHYAKISLILIILKFELISEYTKQSFQGKFNDDQDVLLKFIKSLLDCARYTQNATLPTLQTVFFMRVLKKFDTRDGDGGDGSNGAILMSLAFEMAIIMGLHKDIDYLYSKQSETERTVLKKLWNLLLYYDLMSALEMGSQLHLNDADFSLNYLDHDDLVVKTLMILRSTSRKMNSANLHTALVEEIVSDLQTFLYTNFKPIFELVLNYEDHSTGLWNYDVIRQFSLSLTILVALHHCADLLRLIFNDIDREKSGKYYSLTLKCCLVLVIGSVELKIRADVSRENSPLSLQPYWTDVCCVINESGRDNQRRALVSYILLYALALRGLNSKEKKPAIGGLTCKLSQLQNMSDNTNCLKLWGYDVIIGVKILKDIVTQSVLMSLFLKTNNIETGSLKQSTNTHDYSMFIQLMMIEYLNRAIDGDPTFAARTQFDVNVIYDVFGEYSPTFFNVNDKVTNQESSSLDNCQWLSELNVYKDDFYDKYFSTTSNEDLLLSNFDMF